MSDAARDERELLDLERRRQVALAAGDIAALGALMADDLVHVHATGAVHDKATLLNHLKGSRRAVERRDLKVRIYDDVAVLTGLNINTIEKAGAEPSVLAVYATQVARRTKDGWRFVSFQATRIPEADIQRRDH